VRAVYTVSISPHAELRLQERLGKKNVREEIVRRLIATLRLGVQPTKDLAVYVYLEDGYTAVLYPKVTGGWLVATVLEPEMELREIREAASV